ncbi:hypothetical protein [Streptomyces sp. Ncost-T10-10d]|uniref:hypothetical protein n=1 Tax=Streptomyces sp. Ncost-T10-10d TaxID=1839774 RepID=UPI00081E33F0|nr:hypothetical protein [Streptomyces sp. Ncost-T10-10d]SCF67286.1 hypothetical protein GA0115254_110712 [Streptomyces sp. Ncost-T10-10d]
MTFEPVDLNLTDPEKGYLHFVLYTEARRGYASSSLNAVLEIEASQTVTPHFQEWRSRLEPCEPNAMHCTLVVPTEIPSLFPPCVAEDKDSPSAIAGSGCTCRQTFYDPEFGLPVVAEHFKHAGTSGTDQWSYTTYAPLALRPDDIFSSLITGRGLFWARTDKGLLSILPQKHAVGYNIGYNGGGPHALAAYLTQIARNDGGTTPAGTPYEQAHPALVVWTQSGAAERGTNELTLRDLQDMLES